MNSKPRISTALHFSSTITNTSYRTLEFDKPLSARMLWNIVARWGD